MPNGIRGMAASLTGAVFTLGLAQANKARSDGSPNFPENAEGESEPPLPPFSQSAQPGHENMALSSQGAKSLCGYAVKSLRVWSER